MQHIRSGSADKGKSILIIEGNNMEKINYKKLQPGDLVQVPRYQFAPMRHGWNGWLFSNAVVLRKGIEKKSGKPVVTVEMCIPGKGQNNYETIKKSFFADCVFTTYGIVNAKRIMQLHKIKSKEEFETFIMQDNVTGCDWIKFLIDKDFIF